MKNENNFPYFLDVLNQIKNINNNPFKLLTNNSKALPIRKHSPFGFYEDTLEKELRCPICLGRVSSATKPSNCNHVFCYYCIHEWSKENLKCPICRQDYSYLIPVDIMDPSYGYQSDLYIN